MPASPRSRKMTRFSLLVATVLLLLSVFDHAIAEKAVNGANSDGASPAAETSRVKRSGINMLRLGRGLQMLRLGKRADDLTPEDQYALEELLLALQNEERSDLAAEDLAEEESHFRYRRSADSEPPSKEAVPDAPPVADSDVKPQAEGSLSYLEEPSYTDDLLYPDGLDWNGDEDFTGAAESEEGQGDDELSVNKRQIRMLRLGKRPMNMLRLGKRPMNMLRLGKRPMNMLRLGKRDNGDVTADEEEDLIPDEDEELDAEKRPMNMLRLGKRPMNMLRLGKRPMNMLRLGKRPMNMLRLGKRPMNMLRLGKRPMNMLRLGKRPMNMLRLGKRPMNMLRLGKRDSA